MSLLPPYDIGTVTLERNSAVISGNDTGWLIGQVQGGVMYVEAVGNPLPLDTVMDDDAATATIQWKGASGTYQYVIVRENAAAAAITNVYDRLAQILVSGVVSGLPAKYIGSLADRDALTLGLDDDQVKFERMAPLEPWEIYRWTGTAWLGPFEPQGPAGNSSTEPGPPGTGLTPAGAWVIDATYSIGGYVRSNGRTFASLIDDNIGNEPPDPEGFSEFSLRNKQETARILYRQPVFGHVAGCDDAAGAKFELDQAAHHATAFVEQLLKA